MRHSPEGENSWGHQNNAVMKLHNILTLFKNAKLMQKFHDDIWNISILSKGRLWVCARPPRPVAGLISTLKTCWMNGCRIGVWLLIDDAMNDPVKCYHSELTDESDGLNPWPFWLSVCPWRCWFSCTGHAHPSLGEPPESSFPTSLLNRGCFLRRSSTLN